jgi:16S rRNA (cytosine967-C5)-methyltransferase
VYPVPRRNNQELSHSPAVSPSRRVAYDILHLAAGGGYATDLLLEKTARMDARDAGLTSQLVFGCLRFQGQLDYLIHHYSGRKLEDIEAPVKLTLRLGIYQLRYLDRIPPHAALNETVELAKGHRRAAAGFVNAVLRKVRRNPVRWPDKPVELSCPAWLMERWADHFGGKTAQAIAAAALNEPERYVRVPAGAAASTMANPDFMATEIPGCFRVLSGDARGLRQQDIGSQSVVPLLDLEPGQTFLDLCAAPGNKTAQALETQVAAVACDISWRRLRDSAVDCPRVVLDASAPLPFRTSFDRILIDAPCSGTGTLGRNPEIKWRVQPEDFTRFRDRQVRLLERGLARLKSGGRLVYATCSLEKEENEEVVRKVVIARSGAKLLKEQWRMPGRDPGDGFYAAVITSSDQTGTA